MGAETPALVESAAAIGEPGAVVLLADALSRWPDALLERIRLRRPLTVLAADTPLEDGARPAVLLLGYRDPRAGLAEALAREAAPDLAGLLAAWQRSAERMLQRRHGPAAPVLLIALDRLDAAAQAALLEHLPPLAAAPNHDAGQDAELDPDLEPTRDPEGDPERDPDCETAAPTLPPVVAHYLSQRPEIDQLLADLEACSALLGRDPQAPPTTPPERGLVLAERLLNDWLALRAAHHQELAQLERQRELLQGELATTSGVLADVAGLQQQTEAEAEALRHQLEAEQEALRANWAQQIEDSQQLIEDSQRQIQAHREQLQDAVEQLQEARQRLAEEEARQRDGEEERELILLQLKQVQDELTHTFQELTQARSHREALAERQAQLEERLVVLEEECRTLFLHSRLNPQVDRTRIATILQLVRENLRV
ncbi:MAG: hypothetical protein ACKOZW_06845 [Cyanobium sp.]